MMNEYFTYKRFKGNGLDGYFNLPYGTILIEHNNFLYTEDEKCVCVTTSEQGWAHFHPNTKEGQIRQQMINELYQYYENNSADDIPYSSSNNTYWKNRIRTMPTDKLIKFYQHKFNKEVKIYDI